MILLHGIWQGNLKFTISISLKMDINITMMFCMRCFTPSKPTPLSEIISTLSAVVIPGHTKYGHIFKIQFLLFHNY
jgi:hypothetical protein